MGWKARTAIVAALVGVLCSLAWAATAGATQLVEFESAAAVAANAPVPPVPAEPLEEAKEACGSSTSTWGSELLTTEPKNIKVPNEWGDIVPGKEMMVSGTVHNLSTPGDADIPIDHPFSADTTFDVTLDEPYWSLARELTAEQEGHPSKHELHMELETAAFPHLLPQHAGPAAGEPWNLLEEEVIEREGKGEPTQTLLDDAVFGQQLGYIPQEGDRIAMRGRWLIDCGHADFHGELHPITFMAFGHEEGKKTVVHVLANPYRVTQLYGPSGIEAITPTNPQGKTLPAAFEESVNTLVNRSLFIEGPHPLELLVGLEKTLPSTVPFKVCAPEGDVGNKQATAFSFVKRGNVKVEVKHPLNARCTTITATIGEKYKVLKPHARKCELPWKFVSTSIAESLGISEVRPNEVELIKMNATGGTFTITYASETTGPINYNANATEVKEALELLPAIGAGNIEVLGAPGGPYRLEFVGALGEQAITPVTTNTASLTGGKKLATVIVLRPGGKLDLRRFILSEIELKAKVALEENGLKASIARIEANMALSPQSACTDPLSAPVVNLATHMTTDNTQAFPYYGEVQVEVH
jgi:hypothetical protein